VKEEKEETNVYEVGITVTIVIGDKTATKDFTYTYEESKAATDEEVKEGDKAKTEVEITEAEDTTFDDSNFGSFKLKAKKCKSKKKKITVKWTACEGAQYYVILVSNKKNGFYERNRIVPASKTSYTISKFRGKKLKKGTNYFIKIQPIGEVGEPQERVSETRAITAKKKGKLTVNVSANADLSVRKIFLYMSTTGGEDESEWKQVGSWGNTMRTYSKVLKKFNGAKIKKGTTYYLKAKYTYIEGDYGDPEDMTAPIKVKCKK
ncbi:MAG: hypothetical protein II699_05350, partial [Lachnospiraceae bacterium]|nr:hypothetical protein [Lachnospiraceae bacterium]